MTGDYLDMEALARHICGPWRNGHMQRRLLFTCWRPGGNERPWTDQRIERTERALIDAGHLQRIDGFFGYELRVTAAGVQKHVARAV